MRQTSDVVIIGAGIAGVTAAYELSVRRQVGKVVLIDPRPPLTLTSDKSTECYRNWWPSQAMVALMNRSIDLFEEFSADFDFGLNQRGYLFVTGSTETYSDLSAQAGDISDLGARAQMLPSAELLDRHPFLTDDSTGALFVERAGWFRAQALGQWMLDQARNGGTELVHDEVVDIRPGAVVCKSGDVFSAGAVVIAGGPMSPKLGALAGLELPLTSELHLKVAFKDHLGVIPRDAPMTIWNDEQQISWSDEEREGLADAGRDDLLGTMPMYCHFRPEGGSDSPYILALWEYHDMVMEPTWPLPEDPLYPEAVMRGLTTMVPGLAVYLDRLPEAVVDGGYYTKTPENRPLIGPSGVDGVHLLVGYSGFGVMVSAGAADLLGAHLTGSALPDYADSFALSRYEDPTYIEAAGGPNSGQL